MSRDRLRDALAEADRSGKQRMELALAAEASAAKARVSDAEEKLRRQVEELKTLATKVVGLTAEKDNLSSRLDRTTGDLARERKAVRDMTELKEHQLSEMQAAHSRVLEAKREEATKQLREVKIEVREAKLEAGRQIREAEMKARDSIHEAQAEAARQMDEVAEEKRATEAERESVRARGCSRAAAAAVNSASSRPGLVVSRCGCSSLANSARCGRRWRRSCASTRWRTRGCDVKAVVTG